MASGCRVHVRFQPGRGRTTWHVGVALVAPSAPTIFALLHNPHSPEMNARLAGVVAGPVHRLPQFLPAAMATLLYSSSFLVVGRDVACDLGQHRGPLIAV